MSPSSHHVLPSGTRKLVAFEAAQQAAVLALTIIRSAPAVPGDLKDQLARSVARVPLTIREAMGRTGRDRTHLLRVAYGGAQESSCALQLLVALGALPQRDAAEVERLLDRSRRAAFGLIRKAG